MKQYIAIIGENGVGKSTIYRYITGEEVFRGTGVFHSLDYLEASVDNSIIVDTPRYTSLKELKKSLWLKLPLTDICIITNKFSTLTKEVVRYLRSTFKGNIYIVGDRYVPITTYGLPLLEIDISNNHLDDIYNILDTQSEEVVEEEEIEDKNISEDEKIKEKPPRMMKVGLLGRSNAGKSTMFNKLIGEERVQVRDSICTTMDFVSGVMDGYMLYDSAGLCDHLKVNDRKTFAKVIEFIKTIDLVAVVIDMEYGITQYDWMIIRHCQKYCKGWFIVINKYDINSQVPGYFKQDPILCSAKTGFGLRNLRNTINETLFLLNRKIKTRELNALKLHKVKYISQIATNPPHFFIDVQNPFKTADLNIIKKVLKKMFFNEYIQIRFKSHQPI